MESLVEENARLRREVAELKSANERLQLQVQELDRRVQELLRALEEALPGCCPHCGGELEETKVEKQYQTETPQPRVERIEFRIHVGQCKRCGRRVQGRHARQSSDAVGSAASQLGARAVALATELNKGMGLSHGKTAALLKTAFGLEVSRGGLAQAFARIARKAEPTYQQLVRQIRGSPSVTPDETGWKVNGKLWWMWAFSSDNFTVYSIQPGRGFEQANVILGEDFDGFLVRDGWVVYRRFTQAVHQTCVAHLLRRCGEMLEVSRPAATALPSTVKQILQAGLNLRDRRDREQIGEQGLAIARGKLEASLERVLSRNYRSPANRRFANHLRREREAIFTFLYYPGLDATNYRAEQAIRPMVVTRKVWGGNRTEGGAHTQSVLVSILQTCRQQLRPATEFLQQLLHLPKPKALELVPPTPR